MSIQNRNKINLLFRDWPPGTVCTTSWLNDRGYSNQLLNRYKKSGWLESVGTGAWIRSGDQVNYEGAVYALQKQLGLSVHSGGKSALAYLGKSHYLELAPTNIILFGYEKETLPSWCKTYDWKVRLDYHQSTFLPPLSGLTEITVNSFSIHISSAARAMLECLYLASTAHELVECYEIMESMNSLRPALVNELLKECQSVKVKRLFLYMAAKAGHQWFEYLDIKDIDLGHGKRSLVKNGAYIPKYLITVPKEFEGNGSPAL